MLGSFDGGVTLHLCGAPRRLRFDWNALGELRAAHGPNFQDAVNSALDGLDFAVMADLLSLATGRAVSAEAIFRDPPPIVLAARSLVAAFNNAYHGPDGPPKRPLARARAIVRAILSKISSAIGSARAAI